MCVDIEDRYNFTHNLSTCCHVLREVPGTFSPSVKYTRRPPTICARSRNGGSWFIIDDYSIHHSVNALVNEEQTPPKTQRPETPNPMPPAQEQTQNPPAKAAPVEPKRLRADATNDEDATDAGETTAVGDSGDRTDSAKPSEESKLAPINEPVNETITAGGAPAVRILGRGDGVVIQLAEAEFVWGQMLEMLTAHLSQAHGFFRGERVTLELGAHAVGARDLQELLNVLGEQEVQLRLLRTAHPGVHQLGQDMGLAVTWQDQESAENRPRQSVVDSAANWEVLLSGRRRNPARTVTDFEMPSDVVDAIADAVQSERRGAPPADSTKRNEDEIVPAVHSTVIEHPSSPDLLQRISAPPYLYRGTLRSGQIFRHAGSVIVVGDVNPGAQVVSGSDVYIWGKLRGVVHAGAMGDEKAVIGALDFEPVQVRIAGFIAMSPRGNASDPGRWFWKRQATDRPEIARVVNGQVVVDQWDARMPNKSGR